MTDTVENLLEYAYGEKSIRQSGINRASIALMRDDEKCWNFLARFAIIKYTMDMKIVIENKHVDSFSKKLKDFFCFIVDEGLIP